MRETPGPGRVPEKVDVNKKDVNQIKKDLNGNKPDKER